MKMREMFRVTPAEIRPLDARNFFEIMGHLRGYKGRHFNLRTVEWQTRSEATSYGADDSSPQRWRQVLMVRSARVR